MPVLAESRPPFGSNTPTTAIRNSSTAGAGDDARAAASQPSALLEPNLQTMVGEWLYEHAEALKLYVKWVVGAPVLIVGIIIGMLLRPRRKDGPRPVQAARSPQPPAPPSRAPERRAPRPRPSKPAAKLSDQVQVLRFFLQLFKNQHQAEPDAPAQIVLTERRTTCPDETYEMRILLDGEWLTRRMSLGLLGQGGGSRSRCFYVIYDDHMVIKIPAAPLTRFGDYKRRIAAEGRIVARLAPRLCIVPRVSVILKAVHNFPAGEHWSDERLEAEYVRLLESHPEYQECLKIDDSFAFFMDLARHFFLSTIIEDIHSGYGRLIEEARQHPELVWDHHGFVSRYGEEAGSVCQDLQDAYLRCEGRLRRLLENSGLKKNTSPFQLRQLFLTHMAGDTIRREEYDLPAEVVTKANQLLDEVVRANRPQVERYRRQLTDYIRRTRFSQYRRQFETLSSDMLQLLAWVGRKKLALRDLKPENLFVAGNPDDYPAFLNDPDKFSIGLIDVETAVPIDAEDPVLIPQPQLAGTPLYATPAHLMPNAVLTEVYGDLAAMLHLQDWFATIAIIYKIVSGENLFATTAHVFPEILERLKVLDPAGPDLHEEVIRIQRLFWNSAVAEFQDNLARNAAAFGLVEVAIPFEFVDDIRSALKAEIREIETTVSKAVADQSFFTAGDKRRFLVEASADKVGQMKNKLVQEEQNGQRSQSQVVLYFELLEKLKLRLELKQRALSSLVMPDAVLPLDQLLEIMFQRVFGAMYPPDWPQLAPRLYGSSTLLTTDLTTYQATM